MENVLLQASLFLSAAVIAVPLSQRLGLGSVLGYLLAGVFLGPLLHLIGSNTEQIQHYAEFGVVIMLFLIGLEMRPKRIWDMRESLIGLGGLQIFITTCIIAFIAIQLGLPWQTSLAIALILSLSSTAIVLQTLTEKKMQHTEGGKSAIAILLMQDVAVIPMLAILPLLALQELQVEALLSAVLNGEEIVEGKAHSSSIIAQLPGWISALVIASAIATIILASRYLTEPIIKYIAKYGTREIFLAATFLLIISIAYLMTLVGLSPALGTFLVGLVLSNSQYRHALASDLEPFKGLLLGLFFITVGAGINFNLLIQNLFPILSLTISLIVTKSIVLFILAKIFLLEKNSSFLIALYLSQAGEFGFVLLALAKTAHVVPPYVAENLSLVIALSMLITPLLFFLILELKISNLASKMKLSDKNISSSSRVIIMGLNSVGEIINQILIKHGIDVLVLDHSSSNIKMLRRRGIKALLGDISDPTLLVKAGVKNSEVIVITTSDTQKSINTTEFIIKKHPKTKLIVIARNTNHYKDLYTRGARDIILGTHHGALKVGEKVLATLGENISDVNQIINEFDHSKIESLLAETKSKSIL
ncbi:MAG: cation:proton antiporter [Paracoccaceae bacterium]|nr:cation:proton antiporter [Paracoccaceae bacterium]